MQSDPMLTNDDPEEDFDDEITMSNMKSKDLLACLCYMAKKSKNGMATLHSWCQWVKKGVSPATLYRYALEYEASQSTLWDKKIICNDAIMEIDQIMVIIGYVVECARSGERIYYRNVQAKISEWFDIEVSYNYVRELCQENGLRVKKVNTKGPDSHLTDDELVAMILEEVCLIDDIGYFNDKSIDRGCYVMVDYITNTIYNRADTSLQAAGI